VRYYDNVKASWIIVEQTVATSMYEKAGKQYWALVGSNPVYISQVAEGTRYNPDEIVLTKDPADQYYSPAYVTSAGAKATDNVQKGKIISFNTLVKSNITNDFLLQFGWKWPENKSVGNFDLSKSTLYLIQVSNTLDAKLGLGFYENHLMMKKLWSNAAQTCNINFKSIEITGSDYNKTNVQKTIADLTPGPNDIVIFYYSGHGYRYDDQQSQWPRMALTNTIESIAQLHENSLSINDDVYQPLTTKGAHLLMVFGECCNTSIGPTPTVPDPVQMVSGEQILDVNAMKTLLKQSGNMLLATSAPKESTWYYQTSGGCFGNNFVSNVFKEASFANTSNTVSWKDVIDNSVKQTVNTTGGDFTPAVQDPILMFDIK
jgi:hypothetical protein